jgi:hypothetical protein
MHVAYAFLARAGEFTPDGTLNVLGGDIDTIYGRAFPVMQPHIAFILKIVLDAADLGRTYEVRVSLVGPQGERPLPGDVRLSVHAPVPPLPDRPAVIAFALHATYLVFQRPGIYTWHAVLDNEEIAFLLRRRHYRTSRQMGDPALTGLNSGQAARSAVLSEIMCVQLQIMTQKLQITA